MNVTAMMVGGTCDSSVMRTSRVMTCPIDQQDARLAMETWEELTLSVCDQPVLERRRPYKMETVMMISADMMDDSQTAGDKKHQHEVLK